MRKCQLQAILNERIRNGEATDELDGRFASKILMEIQFKENDVIAKEDFDAHIQPYVESGWLNGTLWVNSDCNYIDRFCEIFRKQSNSLYEGNNM